MNKIFNLIGHLNNVILKEDKIIIKYRNFKPFIITKTKISNEIILLRSEGIIFEYWIKQDIIIPPWETHWFQLKDNFLLKLNNNLLDGLVKKAIRKAGNTNQLCKKLDLSHPSFTYLKSGKIKMVSVKKIKKILEYLDIPFSKLNYEIEYTKKGRIISIKKPNFPFKLSCKEGVEVLGHIVSDGCLYIDKKARNVIRTKYCSDQRSQIDNFKKMICKIFGEVHFQEEFERNCITIRIGSSIIGNSLVKIGGILGHKASNDKRVPWMIRYGNKEFKRHYLKSAFTDEGCVFVGKKYGYIAFSRYKHIKNLTKEQKIELEKIEK